MPLRPRRLTALACAALLAVGVAACSGDPEPEPRPTPQPTPSKSTEAARPEVTFGVYGSTEEIAAYRAMAKSFSGVTGPEVRIVPWSSSEDEMTALENGAAPDVFLLNRRHLGTVLEAGAIRPVDDLLDARGVDFADDYARDALRSFSADERLQCMPYGVSPMVVYINTALVDFAAMAAAGLPAPELDDEGQPPKQWSMEEFAAAADFATRPRRGTRGLSIEPTLQALTPFIRSGGGQIFDDDVLPTTLTLSDDSSVDALERTLETLRDGRINLTDRQLAKRDAVEWFERGKVGMIAGFRDLVPRLRAVNTLDFDVMAMPVLDEPATVGDITGLCVSAEVADSSPVADFLAYAISTDAVTSVAREGYLMPANLEVAATDAFLQDGRRPANSQVFVQSVRDIYHAPLLTDWADIERIAGQGIDELLTAPVLDRDAITEIAQRVDEESQSVLAPEETEAPSGTPVATDSASPSGS